MTVKFHGHAVLSFNNNDTDVIIDPFINGNDLTDLTVENIKADYIILTHGHNDHVGDTIEIAKNNNATVIAPVELAAYVESQGVENTVGMNVGGEGEYDFGKVKFVHAFHTSSYTDGEGVTHYTGEPMGLILTINNKKVYVTGDTGLFGDMELIAKRNGPIDVCFIPIGDHFTMGIDDAAYAINELIKPTIAVPVHFDTFPPIKQDPEEFKDKVRTVCQVLKPGEAVQYS
ncbi:metal-dependent hydrolase [Jeotgalicoccus sp. FSL K6-3177]|uniref:metal-dependent hydrolase n=1 Tax=Jeotgalicoccus sp. FSL K6-3177 TaxID=2921494 RepID=UPI0030FDA74D